MTNSLLYLFIAGVAVFLVGINLAFIAELHGKLAGWFTAKLLGVTGLLAYVGLSVLLGDPTFWRALIAFVSVAVDLVAFVWMYGAVQSLRQSGVTGLIPLARIEREDG